MVGRLKKTSRVESEMPRMCRRSSGSTTSSETLVSWHPSASSQRRRRPRPPPGPSSSRRSLAGARRRRRRSTSRAAPGSTGGPPPPARRQGRRDQGGLSAPRPHAARRVPADSPARQSALPPPRPRAPRRLERAPELLPADRAGAVDVPRPLGARGRGRMGERPRVAGTAPSKATQGGAGRSHHHGRIPHE